MSTLAFRIVGTMAAWGTPGTTGGERPSLSHPSRSAILGFVAAALGYSVDDPRQDDLRGLLVAAATHGARRITSDYRTAQSVIHEGFRSRAHALAATPSKWKNEAGSQFQRMQTGYRQHVEDTLWRVFLTPKESYAGPSLGSIAEALTTPTFPLYIGRREFPLSLPCMPMLVAGDLQQACGEYPVVPEVEGEDVFARAIRRLRHIVDRPTFDLNWDKGFPGAPVTHGYVRKLYDEPVSRSAWRFGPRHMVHATVQTPPSASPAARQDDFFNALE